MGKPAFESATSATELDVKSQVAATIIKAMEEGVAPWQKPWGVNSLSPINPTTNNAYKGVNRILLGLSGRSSNQWVTYQQAAEKGWQVRKGEKGTMIVKVVEVNHNASKGQDREGEIDQERKAFALKRYVVFNAEQIEGIPPSPQESEKPFVDVPKANAVIEAMQEKGGLLMIYGGDRAFYSPKLDEVRMPPKRAFKTEYDFFSTAFHELSHSTLHEKRLNRTNALGQKWGDEAYSMEELRAEISAAILASETGVNAHLSKEAVRFHNEQHASYLQSWVRVIKNNPMAIFSAAKDAEAMASYILGLEKQMTAMAPHKEWVEEYERTCAP